MRLNYRVKRAHENGFDNTYEPALLVVVVFHRELLELAPCSSRDPGIVVELALGVLHLFVNVVSCNVATVDLEIEQGEAKDINDIVEASVNVVLPAIKPLPHGLANEDSVLGHAWLLHALHHQLRSKTHVPVKEL